MNMDTNLTWQERLQQQDPGLRTHMIGIGGAGLSAIAKVMRQMGLLVSGSDSGSNQTLRWLSEAGVELYAQQSAENLLGLSAERRPDVVLISSAVPADNPERMAAEQLQIPTVKRAQFLSSLLADRRVIAVAGTHGKSTTTSMIVSVLAAAGLEPGYIIGADLPGHGSAAAGKNDLFVIEADEYDYMFHGLRPHVAVVTNVEWDNPDCFPTPAIYRNAFADFVARVVPGGLVISCHDDEGAERLRRQMASSELEQIACWITYGLAESADIRAYDLEPQRNSGYSAALDWWNAPAGTLQLQVPGVHNIANALATLAVACWSEIPSAQAIGTLYNFRGAARRFEEKGEANGITVLDDYAHHPTEIQTILAATRARYPGRKIWAIFQPHTFSRTKHMLYRMGDSFEHADQVIVTDIFAARETDDGSVSAAELVAASSHPNIQHMSPLNTIASYLAEHVGDADVVITLGAGDSFRVGEMLLDGLRGRAYA